MLLVLNQVKDEINTGSFAEISYLLFSFLPSNPLWNTKEAAPDIHNALQKHSKGDVSTSNTRGGVTGLRSRTGPP